MRWIEFRRSTFDVFQQLIVFSFEKIPYPRAHPQTPTPALGFESWGNKQPGQETADRTRADRPSCRKRWLSQPAESRLRISRMAAKQTLFTSGFENNVHESCFS